MFRIALLVLLFQNAVFAQFYPFKKNDKWGLIDKDGKAKVEPIYSYISDYKNGLAVVKQGDKTSVLGSNGLPILPFEYDQAKILLDLAIVWKNGKCELFNKEGKKLVETTFSKVSLFANDKIKTQNQGLFGLLSADGREILPCQYETIAEIEKYAPFYKIVKNKKFGLLRADWKLVLEAIYSQIWVENTRVVCALDKSFEVYEFDEKFNLKEKESYINRAALDIALKAKQDKSIRSALQSSDSPNKWISEGFKFKLINKQAQNVLGMEFYDVSIDKKNEKSLARRVGEDKKDICYYIDNIAGKIIFQAKSKDILISDFELSDFAKCTVDTLWDALISKKGEILTHLKGKKIKNIGLFNEKGLANVEFVDGEFGFINSKSEVLEQGFEMAANFVFGFSIAKKNGKFGAYPGIPFDYDGIQHCEDGLFRVKKGKGKQGKWGVINTKNAVVIPFEYDFIYPFEKNTACANKNGKTGLIDRSAKIVLPIAQDVDFIFEVKNSVAKTAKGKIENGFAQYGFINLKAETIIDCQYQQIEGFEEVYAQKSGIAKIYKNNKVGFVNHLGTVIIEPIYDRIENLEKIYKHNKGIAKAIKNEKIGYFDATGRLAIDCAYDEIENFEAVLNDSSLLFKVKSEKKYGFINARGKIEVPIIFDELSPIRNGYICAQKDKLWGIINAKGETAFPFLYAMTEFLPETDLILLAKQTNDVVYFNNKGEAVANLPKISNQLPNSEKLKWVSFHAEYGIGIVKKDNFFALSDQKAKLLTKFDYLQIKDFSSGLALFQDKAKKYGYFDKTGKIAIAAQYHRASDFGDGIAAVAVSPNKWQYIKTDGSEAFKGFFRQAQPFLGGFAIVNENEIINTKGEKMGLLTAQSEAKFFSERAIAKDEKGFFHIGPSGAEAYWQRFDEVTPFFAEIAFAKKGEIWELTRYTAKRGELDPSKVHETKIKFTRLERELYLKENGENKKHETPLQITQDIAWRKVENGLWRMIDTDGNLVSDAVYRQVEVSENGVKALCERNFGVFANGNLILQPIYESIRLKNGLLRIEKKGNTGYLSKDGEWILKLD